VAPDVWRINGLRVPNLVNAYLVGDVLIDAGVRSAGDRILRELHGREVKAHALTHAHTDHQGSSHQVCEQLGIPYWVPEGDVRAAEIGFEEMLRLQPDAPGWLVSIGKRWVGPGHPVDRPLHEGDEVAGFRVIDTPGHSPGQVVYWRESDRVLIIGDVLGNLGRLGEHPAWAGTDAVENRRSAKKLLPLEPELVLFGHGPPLRDTEKFVKCIEDLPD
jgi:glyoxylase-like metal-dependent hydrolase (beta-lactamase superfamily II)